MTDWTGNMRANTLNTAVDYENREKDDFYSTDPNSLKVFLDRIKQDNIELSDTIWEPCVGSGTLADVLKQYGYKVFVSDIIDRGYAGTITQDFLNLPEDIIWQGDILTNPPFKYALECL